MVGTMSISKKALLRKYASVTWWCYDVTGNFIQGAISEFKGMAIVAYTKIMVKNTIIMSKN